MDPRAVLARMLDPDTGPEERYDAAEAMWEWLFAGGFVPSVSREQWVVLLTMAGRERHVSKCRSNRDRLSALMLCIRRRIRRGSGVNARP